MGLKKQKTATIVYIVKAQKSISKANIGILQQNTNFSAKLIIASLKKSDGVHNLKGAKTMARIDIRLTDEQKKRIEEKARENGFETVTDYILFCSLNAEIRIIAGKTPEQELLEALKFIDEVGKNQNINSSVQLLDQRRKEEINKYTERTHGNA